MISPRSRARDALVLLLAVALQAAMLLWLSKSGKSSRVDATPDQVNFILIAALPARPVRPTPTVRRISKPEPKAPRRQVQDAIKPAPATVAAAPPMPEAELAHSPESVDSGMAERAVQVAGRVDRELRAGAPGVLSSSADTPTTRMRRAMEGAYSGGGNAASYARYVSADGVSISRITRGGRAICYVSAVVNMSPAAAMRGAGSGGGGARQVNCPPADAGWSRQ